MKTIHSDSQERLFLEPNEKIIFDLRALYNSYGYSHYKMSKFEEYDLYSRNKDFLISDGVITFTDTNGKLMALKPDVTLSIVKNTEKAENAVQKLCYNENVYRVSKSSRMFKEIMQVGLECIGNVDDFCIYEVLKLALRSLDRISENNVLDISSLDILVETVEAAGIPESEKENILHCISEKNTHELAAECRALGIAPENIEMLKKLVSLSGAPGEVLPKLEKLLEGKISAEAFEKFKSIVSSLNGEKAVNIDFSLVDDIKYYNGIVFKGFVEGVPSGVLSGGQYDTLMKKMKRSDGAIGFAVYLDMLEYIGSAKESYDIDILLLYGESSSPAETQAFADSLRSNGDDVLVLSEKPQGIRCRKILTIENGEVKTVENNA